MATLDEMLDDLPPTHTLNDPVTFEIDEDLRTIKKPARGNVLGVQDDNNVNHINFKMPRYYNGIDLSTFTIKINYKNALDTINSYFVDDLMFGTDTMTFSWLVSKEVTVLTGTVEFVVKLFTTLNGEINKFFSTAIAEGIVLPSISVEDETLIPTPEIRNSIMEELLLLKERITLLENG